MILLCVCFFFLNCATLPASVKSLNSARCRDGRERQEHLHQADENHSRFGLHGGGQERVHQAGLPEHIHLRSSHDPIHGNPSDSLQIWTQRGNVVRLRLASNYGLGVCARNIVQFTLRSFQKTGLSCWFFFFLFQLDLLTQYTLHNKQVPGVNHHGSQRHVKF